MATSGGNGAHHCTSSIVKALTEMRDTISKAHCKPCSDHDNYSKIPQQRPSWIKQAPAYTFAVKRITGRGKFNIPSCLQLSRAYHVDSVPSVLFNHPAPGAYDITAVSKTCKGSATFAKTSRFPVLRYSTNKTLIGSSSEESPGVGAYFGGCTSLKVLKRSPSYTIRLKTVPPQSKLITPGADVYGNDYRYDVLLGHCQSGPKATIGNAKRVTSNLSASATALPSCEPHVGPGSYATVVGFSSP